VVVSVRARIRELAAKKFLMVSYLLMKADEEDWHGVQDAASDLRDIEAEVKGLLHKGGRVILDPEDIPSEIKDQIEAAGDSLGKALVQLHDGTEPQNTDPRVLSLAEGLQRALTAFAMMILEPAEE
jgi:hypothetical protein